jgi:hypothetical protein
MPDCKPNIDADTHIISCEFEPGPSADAHLYWYSPFDSEGKSSDGAYQITAADDVHKLARTNMRGIHGIVAAHATCDLTSAGPSPMCVAVDPVDQDQQGSRPMARSRTPVIYLMNLEDVNLIVQHPLTVFPTRI